MTDIFTKEKRSHLMSKISRKDTPQEILVRRFLFSKGFRFRKNYRLLPGSPDIVLYKHRIVIFVNGCFWHGHQCKAGKLPSSNLDFWGPKIHSNKKRDQRKNRELKKAGWYVIVLWQCKLSSINKRSKTLTKLLSMIADISKN